MGRTINFTLIIEVFILVLFLLFLTPALVAYGATTSDLKPELQVNIGSQSYTFSTVNCQGGSTCQIDWIGQYIKAIFQYGVTAAAILTVIMIMVGGFLWLTAGGTPDRVSKGKDFITSALVGMFLALFSYLLLYTINPNLVNLQSIKVTGVKNIDLTTDDSLDSSLMQQATAPHYVPLVTPSPQQGAAQQQDLANPPNLSGIRVTSIMPQGRITGRFGDSRNNGSRTHQGIDIAGGGEAYLPVGGRAIGSGYEPVGGGYVIIESNVNINGQAETVRFVYRHITSPQSLEHQIYLPAGSLVGSLATPGSQDAGTSTTGRHLHLEVWRNGQREDPCRYINCN